MSSAVPLFTRRSAEGCFTSLAPPDEVSARQAPKKSGGFSRRMSAVSANMCTAANSWFAFAAAGGCGEGTSESATSAHGSARRRGDARSREALRACIAGSRVKWQHCARGGRGRLSQKASAMTAISVLRRASLLAKARARCERAWRTFARTLARRARTTARSPCGFRPRERSPCESHGEVLLNPTGPRRSLTRMDLPARKPWGIRIVTIAARHCRRSSLANKTKCEFNKENCSK